MNIKVEEDKQAMKLLRQKAESFVLISNVPESMLTPTDILKKYGSSPNDYSKK